MDIKIKKDKQSLRIVNTFLIKYINLIVALIVIIILVTGFLQFVKPKYDKVSQEMKSSVELKKEEQTGLKTLIFKLDKYWNDYKGITEINKNRIDLMLPGEKRDAELFVLVEKIVNGQNLLLANISINSKDDSKDTQRKERSLNKVENNKPSIGEIEISISVVGVDYKNLKKLLNSFENNLRLFDIKSLNFSPGGQTLGLTMSTYYIK